ncbi:PadR family transcriptional regulator [Pseudonocardia kunmingensis]|uniref:PadR family transcriptional regulator n=1 Tax=Pseudonocardia kunmingensis TaxID=630975 RepID=A0A543E159_9PSEU|nr:PadR family transcriptional regulator [Pseudonocardia kunmingensis]TQM15189.1 PadR family transcriptional regulator [Pseudonocardia kunmingensis]
MPHHTHRRSPLAVQLLLLLAEEPMHAYRMQQLIKARQKDRIVNIAQRNSVYQTLDRLLRAELIAVADTERAPGRPERTIYRLTDHGHGTLEEWLRQMLSAPAREFPEFPVALAALPHLTPERAADLLEHRAQSLRERLRRAGADAERADRMGLPRLFMLEDEYQRAITETELRWVNDLVDDLRAGGLTWNSEWLHAVSRRLSPEGDGTD